MNELKVINEKEVLGKHFRVYGTFESPLFLARDVAKWIDYSKTSQGYYNTSKMLMTIDEDEKMTITNSNSGGSKIYLTEDGLYEVLMQSRKPIAKEFKKQVKKILKEIRMTGKYLSEQVKDSYMISDPVERAKRWIEEEQRVALLHNVEAQKEIIAEFKPKVDYYEEILNSDTLMTITQIAKDFGMSGARLNSYLNSLGIQYKTAGQWVLYSKYENKGFAKGIPSKVITHKNGTTETKMITKWTMKGMEFIYNKLKEIGIYPIISESLKQLEF